MASLTEMQNKQSGTQVAASPAQSLAKFLEKQKAQLAAALPSHIKPERMIRLALTSFSSNGALQKCDATSVFASIILACQLGLEIGVQGQGYLVPYKGKCTFVPGWQGIVDLVARAGRATVWTGAVFQGDEFDYSIGDRPFLSHRQGDNHGDPDFLTHVYAIGRVNGAEYPVIEVWSIPRAERHRNKYNKVGSAHYSYGNFEMYARKVALLQVLKYMPKSVELAAALEADKAQEQGKAVTIDTKDFVVVASDEPETGAAETSAPAEAKTTTGNADKAPPENAKAQQYEPTPEEKAAIHRQEMAESQQAGFGNME